MRPQHLALCLFCAVVSGKRTKKTKQPTTAPTPAQTAASGSTQATLLYENASCEGSDQGAHLGTPASVDECAVSAAAAGCDMFMFSESYGYAWGCRCCSAKTQYHNNWSIYSVDSKNSQRTTPRPTTAPAPRRRARREPAPASATAALVETVECPVRSINLPTVSDTYSPAGAAGNAWRAWADLTFDGPITTASLTLTWRDQGWGNNKGALQITGSPDQVVHVDRPGGTRTSYWKTQTIALDVDAAAFPEIILKYRVGSDGGHQLHIKDAYLEVECSASTPPPSLGPAIVHGSLTLSGLVSPTESEPVLQDAVARVADVPTDAVRITNIRSVQRRQLRRRLESTTVVVEYEIEATDSEAVARKLAEASPAVFNAAIQDAAEAAGAESAFADVRTEEISVASAEESEDDDDASTSIAVKLRRRRRVLARGRAGGRWALRHGAGKKTPGVVVQYPKLATRSPLRQRPGAPGAGRPWQQSRSGLATARATGEADSEYEQAAPRASFPGPLRRANRPGGTAGSPLLWVQVQGRQIPPEPRDLVCVSVVTYWYEEALALPAVAQLTPSPRPKNILRAPASPVAALPPRHRPRSQYGSPKAGPAPDTAGCLHDSLPLRGGHDLPREQDVLHRVLHVRVRRRTVPLYGWRQLRPRRSTSQTIDERRARERHGHGFFDG